MQLLLTLPMTICGILAIELLLNWQRKHSSAQGWLALWALTSTALYAGHYLFFNHAQVSLPLSDTIYVGCNLAVFPYTSFISVS